MFIAALDASGSEDTAIFVVAGFVAPESAWESFGRQWQDRLNLENLPYFHMREFAHSVGPWKSWKGDERRRRNLYGDLISIIVETVSLKVGSVIAVSRFERIPQDLREHFRFTKYSLAARTVAADIRRWTQRERITINIPMVFEDGDKGKGDLMAVFENDQLPMPQFRNKVDTVAGAALVAPLQAADIIAYEIYNAAEKAERDALSTMRWAIGVLDKIPGEPGIYLEHNIEDFVAGARLTQRLNEWGEKKRLFRVKS